MNGLILKDALQLKSLWLRPYFTLSALLALLISIFFLKGNSIIVIIFIGMILLNSLQTLFTNDQADHWLAYVHTLNISNRKIVFSRYITILGVVCLITFSSALLLVFLNPIFNFFNYVQIGIFIFIIFSVSAFYILFLIPFFYLFNQNGLSAGTIVLLGAIFGIVKIFQLVTNNTKLTDPSFMILLLLVLMLILIESILSYFGSLLVLSVKSKR